MCVQLSTCQPPPAPPAGQSHQQPCWSMFPFTFAHHSCHTRIHVSPGFYMPPTPDTICQLATLTVYPNMRTPAATIPQDFQVFGYARSKMTDAEFREMIANTLTCRIDARWAGGEADPYSCLHACLRVLSRLCTTQHSKPAAFLDCTWRISSCCVTTC